jgi:hypothetical protein
MRALFVLTTVILALALGGVASHWVTPALAPLLVIGFGAAVWASSHLVDRIAGHDVWDFSAPYPYRWVREDLVHDVPPRERDDTEHAARHLPPAA